MKDEVTKSILAELDSMPDEDLIKALQEVPDYGIGELFVATGNLLDKYSEIPTVQQTLKTGTGLQLDSLAEKYRFKSCREDGECDHRFRSRLWLEYYNGVWG